MAWKHAHSLGFSLAEIDTTLSKYCAKSYDKWKAIVKNEDTAMAIVMEELENSIQALEFQLNTRESSRGDFPFTTFSFGKDTSFWGRKVAETILNVRMKGHGDDVKQIAIFPKLVFILRDDRANEELFNLAVKCSSKCLYPDFIPESKATPMGCRSFLPDHLLEDGTNLLWGRGNVGVVSMHLPLIFVNSKANNTSFDAEVIRYVDMIRDIHVRTYDYIGKQKAGSNPLMFCEGGFYGGNLKPTDIIEPIVKELFTASFGITSLNELSILATGKSLKEDNSFAIKTIELIQDRINFWKEKDGYLYSLYATPAESLCKVQAEQFRRKYGIIEGVSDKEFMTNSFHLHVSEDVTQIEKQDGELDLFHMHTGGHIQYVKILNESNLEATKKLIERGVYKYGFYQGVNINSCTCEKCGYQWNGKLNENCPECGSDDVTELNRICGYLGTSRKKGDWSLNDGKRAEVEARVSM